MEKSQDIKKAKTFENLEVYQKALALAAKCFEFSSSLKKMGYFKLADQLQDAAASVPANIAEGYGRYHQKDELKFFLNARSSNNESLSHLLLSHKIGALSEKNLADFRKDIDEVGALLGGYIRYLRKPDSSHKPINQQTHKPTNP